MANYPEREGVLLSLNIRIRSTPRVKMIFLLANVSYVFQSLNLVIR